MSHPSDEHKTVFNYVSNMTSSPRGCETFLCLMAVEAVSPLVFSVSFLSNSTRLVILSQAAANMDIVNIQ